MLYILHGNSFNKRQKKLKTLIIALKNKRPDAEVFTIDQENWSLERLESFIKSQGLFDSKYIVLLRNIFTTAENKKIILKELSNIKDSEHIFILIEDAITPAEIKKLSSYAYKIEEFSDREPEKEEFNIFSFTDKIGERDRRRAWELYMLATLSGKSSEEILGLTIWTVKNIQATLFSKSAEEAGMKPYPYRQAKQFAKNYTPEELEELSFKLLQAEQKSKSGGESVAVSLEKIILEL